MSSGRIVRVFFNWVNIEDLDSIKYDFCFYCSILTHCEDNSSIIESGKDYNKEALKDLDIEKDLCIANLYSYENIRGFSEWILIGSLKEERIKILDMLKDFAEQKEKAIQKILDSENVSDLYRKYVNSKDLLYGKRW